MLLLVTTNIISFVVTCKDYEIASPIPRFQVSNSPSEMANSNDMIT